MTASTIVWVLTLAYNLTNNPVNIEEKYHGVEDCAAAGAWFVLNHGAQAFACVPLQPLPRNTPSVPDDNAGE